MASWLRSLGPGLAVSVGVALIARIAGWILPASISEASLGLVLGMLVANVFSLPPTTSAGVRLASQRILRIGIVLLGARLLLGDIAAVGLGVLGVVTICMTVALSFPGRPVWMCSVSAGRRTDWR